MFLESWEQVLQGFILTSGVRGLLGCDRSLKDKFWPTPNYMCLERIILTLGVRGHLKSRLRYIFIAGSKNVWVKILGADHFHIKFDVYTYFLVFLETSRGKYVGFISILGVRGQRVLFWPIIFALHDIYHNMWYIFQPTKMQYRKITLFRKILLQYVTYIYL